MKRATLIKGGAAGLGAFVATMPAFAQDGPVKAPTVERPAGNSWSGDDAHVLEDALKSAAAQFGKGTKNLLVITPSLPHVGLE